MSTAARIGIIRSACSAVSRKQYNIQEIGLAKQIAKRGMDVDVFLISDKDRSYVEEIPGARVRVFWMKGIKMPGQQGYYPELMKILKQNQYNLIQALDDSQITTVLVSMYCRKSKTPFILWQGMYENYPESFKRVIQWAYDRALLPILRGNSNHCIAKSSAAKRYLAQKNFRNITVVPVGLEQGNFENYLEFDYRKHFDISLEDRLLLYIGKIEQRRNPLFMLDVFEKLSELISNVHLICVGSGPLEEKVHCYAKKRNIQNVHFISRMDQNELPCLYRQSDLFLLPTRYEIFGMVLLEAMYFGTPVISYAAAGPEDVIENGIDGISMRDFDVGRWVKTIRIALEDQDKLRSLGEKAAEKIKTNYLWEGVAEKNYLEIQKALGRSEARLKN